MTTMVENRAEKEGLVDLRGEQKLLATILRESDAWMRLPEGFSPEVLFSPLNRALYHVIDSIYAKGATPDPITVSEALPHEMQGELEKIGGWGFLQTLKDLPVDPKNVDFIAQGLIDLRTRRRIESAGSQIIDMATDNQPVQKVIENIELVVNDIEGRGDSEVAQIGKGGEEFIAEKISHPAEVPGLPSGFPELDKSVQGFQGGRLYVVAAPKKTGKSMILLNWAKYLTIDLGYPVLWISTEHSQTDEYSRLLSLVSEVREVSISNGTFSEIDVHLQRVEEAVQKVAEAPFYFCSMPQFSVTKIKRLTRKFVRVFGVKALFFDYIKAVADTANVREWQELGVLADGLKTLATTENIPVLSAVQINREGRAEWKAGGEMNFDYAAGSDRIGQFMSVGMVLRKPTKKEEGSEGFRVLEVTDNRHGPENYAMLLAFQSEVIKLSEVRRV
jgi:replicative DNA helicase